MKWRFQYAPKDASFDFADSKFNSVPDGFPAKAALAGPPLIVIRSTSAVLDRCPGPEPVWSRIDKNYKHRPSGRRYAGPTHAEHAGAGEDGNASQATVYGLMPTADER